jgi:transcriptional regulator with XRE-family HTH domain
MHAPLRDHCENGHMNGRETVAEYIAKRRKALGKSQEQLAEALRVSRTVVSRWETGVQRPNPEQLGDLAGVLADDGYLASLARHHNDGDRPPLFDPPIRVGDLCRRIGDALIGFMSRDLAREGDDPRYGWRRDIDGESATPSALATAHGLRAVALTGSVDRRVSLSKARETIRRLELPSGGWTARRLAPIARPELTAVVAGTLHESGEEDDYIADRIGLVVDLLDRRAPGAELARPFVLASSLIELSRLELDEATGRRLVDDLVSLSQEADGVRGWPVFVRESAFGPRSPSTVHTAVAVCAISAWARRLDDPGLAAVARTGSIWLQRHADLDLEVEELPSDRGDGSTETLPVRHFTPAWVVLAALSTGADPSDALVDSALRDVLRLYAPGEGIWRWPKGGGEYPTWMTYHGVAALTAWAAAHELD